jgi:Putative DNA-binding domain
MSILRKPIASITEDDLTDLISNEVREGKTIDYKEQLISNSDSDKKEFLYDVTSFANAGGGCLLFGIKENEGVPTGICGIGAVDTDKEILRLENLIRDGVEPRIPGVESFIINCCNNNYVMVLRIPRSWVQPHMVIFKNSSKFYSRNSAGKYQLDVGELRSAFALSESITDRIRNFRQERLSAIISDETPTPMYPGAKLAFHIIPLGAFDLNSNNVNLLNQNFPRPRLLGKKSGDGDPDERLNFDGRLICQRTEVGAFAYIQVFRNGIIESVCSEVRRKADNPKFINSFFKEQDVIRSLKENLKYLDKNGVYPPALIFISLLGVRNYTIKELPSYRNGSQFQSIDRDVLSAPEILIENFECDLEILMKPAFDAIWNAGNYESSEAYDNEGRWKD